MNGRPTMPGRNPQPAGSGALASRSRYFDRQLNATIVQIVQGDYYVTGHPGEVLTTVLGSCIAACVRDPVAACGGMNHFLLPDAGDETQPYSTAMRYGSFSMEQLINAVLAAGGRRDRLEVKVFGGANVVRTLSGIGHKNADFVERFLSKEGFPILASDLRGFLPRKVRFFPASGKVQLRAIESQIASTVFAAEKSRAQAVKVEPAAGGDIELFD